MLASESVGLVKRLRAAFPRQPITVENAAIYAEMLEDLEFELADAAVRTAIATLKFFPTIAEIRDLAARRTVSMPDAARAWEEVRKAFGSVGRYREPKFSHVAIQATVSAMGWVEMCDSENIEATRAHFLKLYQHTCETTIRDANVRPMLSAAEERKRLERTGVVRLGDAVARLKSGGEQ